MKKKIRWGIIGCGAVTEVKSGPAFQKVTGSSLLAVMRRNARLAEDYALRHGVPRWYDDASELINDPEVDAVYIATPTVFHKEYTLAVAEAGKPVYVEKPMAMNYKECLQMIEVCKQMKVALFVAYYRRALPRFLKIKSLLDNGTIGEVRFVSVTLHQGPYPNDLKGKKHWRVDPQQAVGGYFCDLASHTLDILQFFLGEITAAAGKGTNQLKLYDAEDMVSGYFTFNSGVQGVGIWNFNTFGRLDRTEIVGDRGKITFATFGNAPVFLETKSRVKQYTPRNPQHIQQPLIQTIVDELLGRGKCPSTGYTAARTNWVMDRLLGLL